MSSIIEGYNYDIFISYRQKDNKHDGWVTEFVDNLKGELESTFKEEISVYFDINPHDGLLETHDVDESLKEKLKCLVFIPIISRTYCDSKSFAWEHEFKAFVEEASKDQFGLKVKLPNGNVASRVLPVRVHDLDKEDIKLCETLTSGFLRGVEFIYKEPGVNRPLRANEENPHENLNHTLYRNQINKVANSIKDVILGLMSNPSVTADEKIKIGKHEEKAITIVRKSYHTRSLRNVNSRLRKMVPWGLTGLLAILIISMLLYHQTISSESQPVIRFNHQLPQDEKIGGEIRGSAVAISPDGTILAFVSSKNDTTSLYLRRINEFEARLIQGSEGAEAPFFSPDNKWIGFFADGNLKKVSIMGGAPQIICEAKSGMEGSWGEDNTIIYADNYKAGLMRVPSAGGKPEQLTTALKFSLDEGEHSHYWPQILPGGKVILYTIWHNSEDMRIVAFNLESGERVSIIGPGSHGRYTKSGHLIYAWKGDILAVPFNSVKLEVEGPPVPLIKGVMMNHIGLAHFSVSANGSLVYIPGGINEYENMLVLVDRDGDSESLKVQASQSPQFSPDGKNILFEHNQGLANIWIYGMERGILRRFTEKEYETFWAIWTPVGEQIVFNSNMHGGNAVNLFWKRSDGTGSAEQLVQSNYHQQPKCFSNDGKLLIYTEGINPLTGMDILMVQIKGDTTPIPLLNARYNETHPHLSPDGLWLAYVSDESGREEVFVCSFPHLGNKTQISTDGGMEPLWAPNGKELYYRDVTGNKIMAVTFIQEPNLRVEKPRLLLEGKFKGSSGPWGSNYDITPDGKRFLLIEEGMITTETKQISLILNWSADLKSLVLKGKEKQR